ncbi:HAD family hydrolase [Cryobacterium tepidiphilum]|uniref:HAD family hydrolase n=1 Tax=Cryobacterium tepidiphilum TaxID=2486026 RepID=A0A3M8KTK4_9MICO|nr:HAD family hydrolase [Cryobacterium tepidiphilum]RNE56651.1 HAD family hydrolase [Cryobacterium tepidiphilum]
MAQDNEHAGGERRAPAVLFDIDGTLIDSNYLHVEAWNRAFTAVGHPVDSWRIHRAIGMGSDKLLPALIGEDAAARFGDELRHLHSTYLAETASLERPFAGARELLRAVAAHGVQVVLATSASPTELQTLLQALDCDESISVVTSAGDVGEAKPAPDILQVAVDKAGISTGQAVMVGDAVWDVEASKRAGIPCVAVLSGGTGEAALRDAGAVAVYEDAEALLGALDSSPLAALWGSGTNQTISG